MILLLFVLILHAADVPLLWTPTPVIPHNMLVVVPDVRPKTPVCWCCQQPPSCFQMHGITASHYSALLTRETCRCVSRLCALLFLPALMISSTGSTLTPAALRESWQLIVTCSFTILFSSGTAWVFARVLLRAEDRPAFQPVQLAITFPNSAAFPLLLMASLCEQDDVKRYTINNRGLWYA